MKITIRDETPKDIETIERITVDAFSKVWISQLTEHHIIRGLREAGALTLSLVAEVEGKVCGHVAISPITLSESPGSWFGLGPISVAPELQKMGIGSALMQEVLARLHEMNADGCVLVGDPEYYQRFGFRDYPSLTHQGVPQKNVLALPLANSEPRGEAVFHPAFQRVCKNDKII